MFNNNLCVSSGTDEAMVSIIFLLILTINPVLVHTGIKQGCVPYFIKPKPLQAPTRILNLPFGHNNSKYSLKI